jgi:hypothetical protein
MRLVELFDSRLILKQEYFDLLKEKNSKIYVCKKDKNRVI